MLLFIINLGIKMSLSPVTQFTSLPTLQTEEIKENSLSTYNVRVIGSDYVDFSKLEDGSTFGYLLGLIKDVCFAIARVFSRIGRSENYKIEIADKNSDGLICMFHGLKAHPSQHDKIRDALVEELGDSVTYNQPFVKDAGNGKREEIIKPHLEEVIQWAKNHPSKPICLVGISNGVLISSEIAIALKVQGFNNPIKVIGIAGPIFGTTLMNKPASSPCVQRMWNWLLTSKMPFIGGHSPDVVREMSWGGDPAKSLVERIRTAAECGVSFEFCATSDDSKVVPAASGMPSLVKDATYHSFKKQGHSSIANAALPIIRNSFKDFIAQNQPAVIIPDETPELKDSPSSPIFTALHGYAESAIGSIVGLFGLV